jgi:hypothetical protein
VEFQQRTAAAAVDKTSTGGVSRLMVLAAATTMGAESKGPNAMETIGKTAGQLTEFARESLREQPGCQTSTVTSIDRIPMTQDGQNWCIGNVLHGSSFIRDIERGTIIVNYQLNRQFHLLTDD